YNVNVGFAFEESYNSGGQVWVTRTTSGNEFQVYPSVSDPGLWSSESGRRFEGTAHAVECFSGDELRVYVRQESGSAVDITSAWLNVYLVDRITQRDTWELVFSAFNFGVTWDGSFWWTTDHRNNANPALFKRSPSGSILNSYEGYDDPPFSG